MARLKEGAVQEVQLDLERMKRTGKLEQVEHVHLCFMGDPFPYHLWSMAAMEIRIATLDILSLLRDFKVKATVLTKGILPDKRELEHRDLLGHGTEWGITLVCLDEHFRETHEPGAPPLSNRINALRQLAYAGEKTWVSVEPLPPPEVVVVDPLEMVLAVSFVNRVVLGRWNYDGYEKTWADWYKDQANLLAEALEGLGKRYEVKDILEEKLTVVIP